MRCKVTKRVKLCIQMSCHDTDIEDDKYDYVSKRSAWKDGRARGIDSHRCAKNTRIDTSHFDSSPE
jgi:hypothetical protein